MNADRRRLAYLVLVTIAVGVASRRLPIGHALWDKSVGDVAYAMMVFFLAAFVLPRARPLLLALLTFAICFAIEGFQATGIPSRMPRVLQIVLGTRFAWHDVACYAVGSALAMLVHRRPIARSS